MNPLLQYWDTPFEAPPFHLVKPEHFRPALEEAVALTEKEIVSIAENSDPPSFENTVEALENSGELTGRISSILFNLNLAETSKELQEAAQFAAAALTRLSNDITLNRALFSRIEALYGNRLSLNLNGEQLMLLEKKHLSFILGGAALDESRREDFRRISLELSGLSLRFEENVLAETNDFELHLTDHGDISGLPEGIAAQASAEARRRKKKGWVFTLHYPSYIPFMQYSDRRHLREKMFRAYNSRAFRKNEKDNSQLVNRMVSLRYELAKLLGYNCYAELALTDRMVNTPEKVYSFLNELSGYALGAAKHDYIELKNFASEGGHEGDLEKWDWAYYSEKLKKQKYNIDDEILKPYLSLNRVRDAIFGLATELFGLKFIKTDEIPVYHHEVETWKVTDRDDHLMALLYTDFHPREGKSGGAWMTSYREQKKKKKKNIRPLISIVTNFSRPTEDKPSLLTFNEFTTFLHEFGHALHGVLSDCTYETLSGTNVARDFVELPSQFMENYAFEQEWLNKWARHYETGEIIPSDIVKMIREASTFNEGYACNRQLSFGFLDMGWHTITSPPDQEVHEFESAIMRKSDFFPAVENTCMSCSFSHLFSGGYAAGYYGYKWAEVLDADAFGYFRETGIFNRETADSFRRNILEKGGTDKPELHYRKFRGKDPAIEAFLVRSGLKK